MLVLTATVLRHDSKVDLEPQAAVPAAHDELAKVGHGLQVVLTKLEPALVAAPTAAKPNDAAAGATALAGVVVVKLDEVVQIHRLDARLEVVGPGPLVVVVVVVPSPGEAQGRVVLAPASCVGQHGGRDCYLVDGEGRCWVRSPAGIGSAGGWRRCGGLVGVVPQQGPAVGAPHQRLRVLGVVEQLFGHT